jgi:hypothetical protein
MKNFLHAVILDKRVLLFFFILTIVFGLLNYFKQNLKIGRFDVEVSHFVENTQAVPTINPDYLNDSIAKEFKKTIIYPKQNRSYQNRRIYFFVVAKTNADINQKGNEVFEFIEKLTNQTLEDVKPDRSSLLGSEYRTLTNEITRHYKRALNYKKHILKLEKELKISMGLDSLKDDPKTLEVHRAIRESLGDVENIEKNKIRLEKEVDDYYNKIIPVQPSFIKDPSIKNYSYSRNSLIGLSFLISTLTLIILLVFRRVIRLELINKRSENESIF